MLDDDEPAEAFLADTLKDGMENGTIILTEDEDGGDDYEEVPDEDDDDGTYKFFFSLLFC